MSKRKLETLDDISSSICNINAPECYLEILPNEILERIFSYLSPLELVALKEIGIRRVTDVSLSFRCADFSLCNTVRTENLLAFFTSDRIDIIQEINFNDLFFVNSENLEKCIVQCKNLTVLSVIECGVTFKSIFHILESCPLLKELYWSVNSKGYSQKCKAKFLCLKKIYFYTLLDKIFYIEVIKTILQCCPLANDVCLNCSSYYTKTLPLYIVRNTFTGWIPFEGRKEPVCFLLTSSNSISRSEEAKNAVLQLCIKIKPTTLAYMDEEKYLNKLLTLPDESVHSLNLYLAEDSEFFTLKHFEKIKKVTGNRLRLLTVYNTPESIFPLGFRKNTEIIKHITSNSPNIAVLNLSETHFKDNFPFPTLYGLKALKVLSFPSCILKPDVFDSEVIINQVKNFKTMIDKCPNVENFAFLGCLSCKFGPDDDGFASIYKWKKLKHLTMSEIRTFRVCSFLKNVAYHCHELTTVELYDLGRRLVCHFMPMVIYIIRQSKKLKFLRINQSALDVNSSIFWKAIESAGNLQGLCLNSVYNAHIDNKLVTDALKKLPFLHVFHLRARHMCQNLKSQVKQIMKKKEIQVSNVVITEAMTTFIAFHDCDLIHYIHDALKLD
ncbi:f-box domain-containing protein [Trichonephila inaurata madagascariensis]|uniref:F-box domain-containing protein n=1 Tax=Trichonephila inaurata madagascariensis TaxID=2747483 RepID=A0A8X6M9N1_9ARAC|nr:f-box domain-containing protein [Trichonephila inaurata madagascariensis]